MQLTTFLVFFSVFLISTFAAHYTIFFLPHGAITQFQTTLTIPPPSPNPNLPGNKQAVWSGLQNEVTVATASGGRVWQNLVINDGAGEWNMMPEYCCSPIKTYDNMKIYQNDTVTSLFTRFSDTFRWIDYWTKVPGTIGSQNREVRMDNAINFDSRDFPGLGAFKQGVLAIELQAGAEWDFGVVQWTNVIIEADTRDIDWCINPLPTDGLKMVIPEKPTVAVDGNKVRCSMKKILMVRDH